MEPSSRMTSHLMIYVSRKKNCLYKHIRETAIKAIFDAFGSENMEKLMILIIL